MDRVDANAVALAPERQRGGLGKCCYPAFGHRVELIELRPDQPGDRCQVDDRAAVRKAFLALARNACAQCLVPRNTPVRLTDTSRCQSSRLTSSMSRPRKTPALLTRIFSPPWASVAGLLTAASQSVSWRHVEAHEAGITARIGDLFGQRLARFLKNIADDDLGAGFGPCGAPSGHRCRVPRPRVGQPCHPTCS